MKSKPIKAGEWFEPHLAFPHGQGTSMTLRDYFAAKAMQAIITNHKLEDCDDEVVASNAYQLADFMLEARK